MERQVWYIAANVNSYGVMDPSRNKRLLISAQCRKRNFTPHASLKYRPPSNHRWLQSNHSPACSSDLPNSITPYELNVIIRSRYWDDAWQIEGIPVMFGFIHNEIIIK